MRGPPLLLDYGNVIPSDPIRCHPRQTCHQPFKYPELNHLLFAAEKFAGVLPCKPGSTLSTQRALHGYIPPCLKCKLLTRVG